MPPTPPRPRTRPDRRRGLAILLWAGGLFAAAQLVVGLLLDHCWPDVRFPQAGRVFARLEALGRTPEIVFMGSSRFEGAVCPYVLDPLLRAYTRQAPRSFNAAVGAGDALVAERMLDRMLRAGRVPALLVLEVSPEHLNRRTPLLGQQVLRQMTWADLPGYLPDACLYAPPMRLVSSRLMPLYVHRYQICKQALAPLVGVSSGARTEPPPPAAEGPLPVPNLRDLPPAEPGFAAPPGVAPVPSAVAYMSDWLRDYRLSSVTTAALDRLLQRCRAEGIDVLLVGVPVMKAHRELYTPEIDAIYLDYVRSLVARYGCRFVDFRDRLPDHAYGDALHYNQAGDEYFCRILAREVLIPLWRERHP